MLVEIGLFFVMLALLTAIGLGPALFVVAAADRRAARGLYALGMAPTMGMVVVGLLSFLLVRYVAPIEVWAWPFLIVLLLFSGVLVAFDWWKHRQDYATLSWRAFLGPAGFILLLCLLLVSPMLLHGIQYASFRSNPSDAFYYISPAETLKTVAWGDIIKGSELSANNLENLQSLVKQSPTALYYGRAIVERPPRYPTILLLAWWSALFDRPAYLLYYAANLLYFVAAAGLTLVLGHMLRLRRWIAYLTAGAITLGFWARYALELDSVNHMSSISLTLLLIVAWIWVDQRFPSFHWRSSIFMGLAATALSLFYFELVPLCAIGFAIFIVVSLVQRRSFRQLLQVYLPAAGFYALFMLISAQTPHLWRSMAWQTPLVVGLETFVRASDVLSLIAKDGIATVWGLSPTALLPAKRLLLRLPLLLTSNFVALILTGLAILSGYHILRRSRRSSELITFCVLLGGVTQSVVLVLLNSPWAAGKGVVFVFPILVLVLAISSNYSGQYLSPRLQKLTGALLGLWLVGQMSLALIIPNDPYIGHLFRDDAKNKHVDFDLAPITRYLDANPPSQLIINVPAKEDWIFPFYAMSAFMKYHPYYQSGIMMDNSTKFQNLWLNPLEKAPDYAVMSADSDYVGANNLGDAVAKAGILTLYRLKDVDIETANRYEQMLRQVEAEKPAFPGFADANAVE